MNLNKVQIIGRVTRDPELKSTTSGVKVCNFSIATNSTWKAADGTKKEDVEFHNCVSFGKTGEVIAQYVRKGSLFYVEGKLKTNKWVDKEQKTHYKTDIIVETFQFGPKASGSSDKPAQKTEEIQIQDEVNNFGEEHINVADLPY